MPQGFETTEFKARLTRAQSYTNFYLADYFCVNCTILAPVMVDSAN